MMSAEGMEQAKARLRNHFLDLRKTIPPDLRSAMSRQIVEEVVQWDYYRNSNRIHCFIPIESMAEVDTLPLLERMQSEGKTVIIPQVDEQSLKLNHLIYDTDRPFVTGNLGTAEQVGGEEMDPADIDLVLVPVLAADRGRNRLGYGKGYYDRFLSATPAISAGLLFSCCISDDPLPVEDHDEVLDFLITEKGIW